MKTFLRSLLAFGALTSLSMAVPYTMLSGVYRYSKLPDGSVSEDFGALYASGEYSVIGNRSYPQDEVVSRGLTLETLDIIQGKYLMDSSFLDSDLATAEGRERLSLFSIGSTKYPVMDSVTVYVLSASGSTPKRPKIQATATSLRIIEGGRAAAIVIKLSRPVSNEVMLRYTLSGTARLKSDYTGPRAVRSMLIPQGASSFRIPVRPVDDPAKESEETIVFRLARNDGYVVGDKDTVRIGIVDND